MKVDAIKEFLITILVALTLSPAIAFAAPATQVRVTPLNDNSGALEVLIKGKAAEQIYNNLPVHEFDDNLYKYNGEWVKGRIGADVGCFEINKYECLFTIESSGKVTFNQ